MIRCNLRLSHGPFRSALTAFKRGLNLCICTTNVVATSGARTHRVAQSTVASNGCRRRDAYTVPSHRNRVPRAGAASTSFHVSFHDTQRAHCAKTPHSTIPTSGVAQSACSRTFHDTTMINTHSPNLVARMRMHSSSLALPAREQQSFILQMGKRGSGSADNLAMHFDDAVGHGCAARGRLCTTTVTRGTRPMNRRREQRTFALLREATCRDSIGNTVHLLSFGWTMWRRLRVSIELCRVMMFVNWKN